MGSRFGQARVMGITRRVLTLAGENGGYLTRSQLVNLGLSPSAIDRMIRADDIVPVSAGVYQVIPSDDHLDLLFGAVLALPNAVVSHQSALHLLRFPALPDLIPTVTVPPYTTHKFPNMTVRRANDLSEHHTLTVAGLVATNAARSLFDYAGIVDYDKFVAIAEPAILTGKVRADALRRMSMELSRRGKRGSRAVNDFLGTTRDSPTTPLEVKGRRIIRDARLPTPASEFPIPWSPRRRFDDAYPEHRVAIEWDSHRWHLGKSAAQRDRERDRLAILNGWAVVRFTWDDVTRRPKDVALQIRQILEKRAPISS